MPLSVGWGITAEGRVNYQRFNGYARQVRFWSVTRTADQIAVAAGESLPADRTGLVAAWPIDEPPESRVIRDLSGAGRALATTAASDLVAANLGRLTAGPYFALATTSVTDGSLQDVEDGQLIDFDSDGDLDVVLRSSAGPPPCREPPCGCGRFATNGAASSMRPTPCSAT